MKILHIFDDYGTPGERAFPGEGSVSSIVYYLAKYAAKMGHEVTILERDHRVLPEKEDIDGIRFDRFRVGKLPAAPYKLIKSPIGFFRLLVDGFRVARKIGRFIAENDFNVIHVHFPFAVSILVTFNKKIREKVVYTAHIGEETKRFNLAFGSPLALRFFSPDLYLMRRARKSVILNEPLKRKLALKGIREDSLEVIPNGVEVDDYRGFNEDEIKRVKEKYGVTDGTTVMFAGTITPRKGVETLMKAAEMIIYLQGRRDILFLLVGNLSIDKDFAEKTKKYVRSRSLENNVKFTGFVSYEDLKVLYAACDIFVLPSFEEGFPIVLSEAMASGKPLIGTNVGGIPMQIRNGWNGFLVEPGNEKQLVEKIVHLLDHPAERRVMGNNSRRLAEGEFDWRKISEMYSEIYKEVAR